MAEPAGWDAEAGGYRVKEGDDWIVHVIPMIFNDRVTFSYRSDYSSSCYTAGWCFDKGGAAALAAALWDPDTQHEPVGYKKVALDAR